jgi:hypothetical protein
MPGAQQWPALGLAAVAVLSVAARCGPKSDCPLEVRRWYLSGKAPQVVLRNNAAHPVDSIVLHVAYEDLLSNYQEPSQAIDSIVQPGQRLTVSLDPIANSVDWETVQVLATCRPAALGGSPAPGDTD